ncbi:hypothetical protein [Gephyromycinifex aptenodytis]|uniref:hypothetical protein n=1 Tax=Gephyromycinifex aptenodytis TaxID=2716227 RepID=UPI001445A04A|nr:hypothetical protein [Gephyromycinifex aptenodytis]
MSRKSRPPKAPKKGKKGKKGAAQDEHLEIVIEESGPPFGLVVLIALVLSIPSLMSFMDGDMSFQNTVIRFLGALAVAWLLVQLVYSVIASFAAQERTTVITEGPPPGYPSDQYRPAPDPTRREEPRP